MMLELEIIIHARNKFSLRELFNDRDNGFVCKVEKTADKAKDLIEIGFDYVDEINHVHLYRNRN